MRRTYLSRLMKPQVEASRAGEAESDKHIACRLTISLHCLRQYISADGLAAARGVLLPFFDRALIRHRPSWYCIDFAA